MFRASLDVGARSAFAQGRLWNLELPSSPVTQFGFTALPGAMSATEDFAAACLHSVADDFAAAMLALGGDDRNCTLEAVKDVGLAFLRDLKRFIVFVTAQFTLGHKSPPQ